MNSYYEIWPEYDTGNGGKYLALTVTEQIDATMAVGPYEDGGSFPDAEIWRIDWVDGVRTSTQVIP